MSVLWRILSVVALVVSAAVLLLAIISVRREQRVRTGLDLFRLLLTLATTLLMAWLLGVDTSEALMGVGLLVGLLLGVYEGLHLRVRFLGKHTFARRTIMGVAAWGAGVVLVQGAGVIGRVGLADFGLALSFLGIGQVIGLLTGRWQTVGAARRTAGGAVALLALVALAGAMLGGLGAPAGAADSIDVRRVMAGDVPGLAVEVRGNGAFMGPALTLDFTNETGASTVVTVPVGLLFVPVDESTQTMVAAGGETLTVPPTASGETYTTTIEAFCGEYHDDVPSPEDVFSAGALAEGELAAVVRLVNQGGTFGREQQEAIWHVTDGYEIGGNAEAIGLVEAAAAQAAATAPAGRTSVAAVDDDTENSLWDCALGPSKRAAAQAAGERRVGFGDLSVDRVRCLTFRYDVPSGGVRTAVLYLSIEAPTDSLQDTDTVAVAVGQAFPGQCDLAGEMAGCVTVHRGFRGGERSLTLDLLDLACDATYEGTPDAEAAVRTQLGTGVLHLLVQDDTAVHGGRLALNEGAASLPCGTSALEAPLMLPGGRDALSAGEGTRTAVVGLSGAAALLLTSLAAAGNTAGSAVTALRSGGWRALQDLARGGGGGGAGVPEWSDPKALVSGGRAWSALEAVPAGLLPRVREVLEARLDAEQSGRLEAAVRQALGPLGPDADPAAALRANPKAAAVLDRLPAGARERFEIRLLAGLEEQRLAGAVDDAARAAQRDRVIGALREAISRRDGGKVQQVLAAVGEKETGEVWPRGVAGFETEARTLEMPPPAPAGTAAPRPFDLGSYLDGPTAGVPAGGEAEAAMARLPAGVRSEVERRLSAKLEADRVSRWVEKLREATGAGETGGSVLDHPAASRLLEALPPDLRERVGAAAAEVIDGEAVRQIGAAVRRMVQEQGAVEMIRSAAAAGDGGRVGAIMDAVVAALDVSGEADLERLASRVVEGGRAALAALSRAGGPASPVDLLEHVAGEADLVAAARRVEGVEGLLRQAGSLRSRVEAEVAGVLDAARVEGAVRGVVERVGPGERAAADVMEAVRELPGVRELLDRMPSGARQEALRLLGERFEGERLEAAVEQVAGAAGLDRAEEALRRAAAAGDLDAADAALAGLSPDQAAEVSRAALG